MSADVIDIATKRPAAPSNAGTRQASYARATSRRAKDRLNATHRRDHILADLEPAITDEWVPARVVADYFGVSRQQLGATANYHHAELEAVGYRPAGRPYGTTLFSRRAILHLALIMRQGTSVRAGAIRRALGVWRDPQGGAATLIGPAAAREASAHETLCRNLLRRAYETAEAVQDTDPAEVWQTLTDLDRHRLQGLVVALAALLPLDEPGLQRHLVGIGLEDLRARELPAHQARAAAAGLAVLVPRRRNDREPDA